jgi:hypothetical protein
MQHVLDRQDKLLMNEIKSSHTGLIEIIRHNRLAIAILLLSALGLLLPIWSVRYPPLLDYPNHLASSFVLAHLHSPQYDFSRYYSGEWGLKPYITTDFLMGALGRIVPPLAAGKLVLSLGALGLPLAAWFFLRQVNAGENAVGFWFLLVGHNIFFRFGFVGFYCSLGLVFLTLGLWLRFLKEPSWSRWVFTCAALTCTYFTHIMGFAFAGLIMGLYSVTRPRIGEWLRSAALFLPGFACYFLSSRVVERQADGAGFRPMADKLDTFWVILHGNSHLIDQISIAAVVAFFFFGWLLNSEFRWQWRWVVVAVGLLITYVAMPVSYGDGYDIDIRALPVLLVLLFVTVRLGRRGWMLAPLALVIFTVRTYDVTRYFHSVQPQLAGLAGSFSMTPPNARVLPIVAGPDEDPILQFYSHFWAYGTIERGWFSPYLFQDPGLLPLNIVLDTYTLDGFWDLSYNEKVKWDEVQRDYDYVYAYDVPDFEEDLEGIGDIIYTSGKLKLFRLHKQAPQPVAVPKSRGKPLNRTRALNSPRPKAH